MLREFRTQRIIWDTANSRLFEPVQAVEGDENGRQLEVQIVNEGKVEPLNSVSLKLAWETQDRSAGNLEPFDVLDASKGLFKLSYPTGMLAHKGRLKASLVIYFTDGKLESREFEIYNQRSLVRTNAMESSNEFTALTQALVKINDLESNYAPRLNEVTRQLEQKVDEETFEEVAADIREDLTTLNRVKADKSEVQSINTNLNTALDGKVSKGANESITWGMLDQTAKQNMASGSIPVVGANSVNTTNIVNGAVTMAKLSPNSRKLGYVPPFNLDVPDFDTETRTLNFYGDGTARIYFGNGSFYAVPANHSVTTAEPGSIHRLVLNTVTGQMSFLGGDGNIPDDTILVTAIRLPSNGRARVIQDILGITVNKGKNKKRMSNKLVNPSFTEGTRFWRQLRGRLVMDPELGYIRHIADGSNMYPFMNQDTGMPWNGDVIYAQAKVRVNNSRCTSIAVGLRGTNSVAGTLVQSSAVNNPTPNEWYDISVQGSSTASLGDVRFSVYHNYVGVSSGDINGNELHVERTLVLNLSQLFGRGNEPSRVQMDEIIKLFPNRLLGEEASKDELEHAFIKSLAEGASQLPEYFDAEIMDTVRKVEQLTTKPALVMPLITDMHVDKYTQYRPFSQTAATMKAVNDYIISDAILNLGDMVDGYVSKQLTADRIRGAQKELTAINPMVLTTFGNHDANAHANRGYVSDPDKVLLEGEFYSYTQRHLDSLGVKRPAGKNYFYKDFEAHKVRIIGLDASNPPEIIENGSLKYNGAETFAFSGEQVEWLANEALQGMPDDYEVLVICHQATRAELLNEGRPVPQNSEHIEQLLKAFNKGGTFNQSRSGDFGFSVNQTFPAPARHRIIAFLYGHIHWDRDTYISDLGIRFMATDCAYFHPNRPPGYGGLGNYRTEGTVTEEVWDVLVLRKDLRQLHFIRFGSGEDRLVEY